MAFELPVCAWCGEPFCEAHGQHYADCPCIGPHQDDEYEYTERDGVLYARSKEQNHEL